MRGQLQLRHIRQSPVRGSLSKLSLAVVFTLGFGAGGWSKSLEDYPEACRKPIDVAAIEIPYDQIDLSASEWPPGTFDLPRAVRSYVEDESTSWFLEFAEWGDEERWRVVECPITINSMVGPIYRLSIDQRYDFYLYRAQGYLNIAENHLIFIGLKRA